MAEQVNVTGSEASNDTLVINGGDGNDTITASNGLANLINSPSTVAPATTPSPAAHGADMLLGGDGNDTVNGGRGNDMALLGAGNDTFVWNPGDGSDIVEGQDGTDTLLFNGSNIGEIIDISANGGRVRLTRDVGNITMDLNSVEHIQFAAARRCRHHHGQRPDRNRRHPGGHRPVGAAGAARRWCGGHRERQRHRRRRQHQRRQQQRHR